MSYSNISTKEFVSYYLASHSPTNIKGALPLNLEKIELKTGTK
jgi:hypothetical protein